MTPAYQIPQLTAEQFAQRMASVYPNGWASNDAKSSGGILFGVMQSLAEDMPFELDVSLGYARDAESILTATGNALDLVSLDFFGPYPSSSFALPRNSGETDTSFEARIEGNLFPTGATRAAVTAAVEKASGSVPRVIEPWSPADTGVWDGQPGQGMMFWDVDTAETPFRWTDQNLNYQGFIECKLPPTEPFGPNPTPCYDIPTQFYWDVPNSYGAWLIDPAPPPSTTGVNEIYNVINRTKVYGTIVWVKFIDEATDVGNPLIIIYRLLTGFPGTVAALPTVEPSESNLVWNNGGRVCISGDPASATGILDTAPTVENIIWNNGGAVSMAGNIYNIQDSEPSSSGVVWYDGGALAIS